MIERKVTLPEIMLLAGTRVALGFGLGLLFSPKFEDDQRKSAGWALVLVGALTTIPLVMDMVIKKDADEPV